jgi:2-methylcitrate dehydratase PrpD
MATDSAVAVQTSAVTRRLAAWASELRYDDLPAAVAETSRMLVLDFLRAVAIGARTPWGASIRGVVCELGGTPTSTILVFGDRIDAPRAAFANGSFAHAADIDDTHVGAMLHPAAAVMPAAFALAERTGASGPQTLAAIVAGYEVAIRIALAVQPSHFRRGFQATGTCGAFGAAAAAAKLLEHPPERLAAVLGTAGSAAAALAQFYYSGSSVKRIHAGRAAEAGVVSALLADVGVEGPADILEGQAGFAHAYADAFAPDRIFDGLGRDYKLDEITIKPHATSARLQASVEALFDLARERPIDPADVAAIECAIPRVIAGRLTQNNPPDCTAAQMSLPFTAALALVLAHERGTKNPLSVDDYQAHIDDAQVRRLAPLVACTVDAAIDAATTEEVVPARVTVRLRDGRSLTAAVAAPAGAPGRQLGAPRSAQLFRAATGGLIPAASIEATIAAVADLGGQTTIRDITALFTQVPTKGIIS